MRRTLEWLGVAVICVAAAAAIEIWCIVPFHCNGIGREIKHRIEYIDGLVGQEMQVAKMARGNLTILEPCQRYCSTDVPMLMLLAASDRFLGRYDHAISLYNAALQLDRRPELYFNLGETQAKAGYQAEALQNLSLACIYNPIFLRLLTTNRAEVRNALDRYQTELQDTMSRQK